jgi:AraC family transcriptional regulator
VSQQPAGPPVIRGGLSPAALRRVDLCLDRYLGHEPYRMPSVAELAAAAGISQYHFIRAFRATEGQTPHAWIMARRVDFALRMILEQRARIDEVADQAGFNSPRSLREGWSSGRRPSGQ